MLNFRNLLYGLAGLILALWVTACTDSAISSPRPTGQLSPIPPTVASPATAINPTRTAFITTPLTAASQPTTAPAPVSPAQVLTPTPILSTTTAPATSAAPTPSNAVETAATTAAPPAASKELTLLVTNSTGQHLSFVNPVKGLQFQLAVGAAPWGVALAPDKRRAYVTTAEGLAVVDLVARQRLALLPYRAKTGTPTYGEYRPGGMGLAVSPDGLKVYVGVYLSSGPSQLEIFDTVKLANLGTVPVGIRPFQVLVSRDGREVYSIDHDSFGVTVIDPVKATTRTLKVTPLGNNSFDKPHYAVLRAGDGHLLLPVQGRALVDLDPVSGRYTTTPLTAETHQHGLALTPDGQKLVIVGTGAAGEVNGGPGLDIFDLASKTEEILPLDQPHENVAISPDGRWAYLTGGYSFANGGWDGLTIVDLQNRTTAKLPVPDRPLYIVILD